MTAPAAPTIFAIGEVTLDDIGLGAALSNGDDATFLDVRTVSFGGRAANLAVFAGALGASTSILAGVGADFASSGYRAYLSARGIDCSQIYESMRALTPHAFVFGDGSINRMYFDPAVLRDERASFLKHARDALSNRRMTMDAVYCTSWIFEANEIALQTACQWRVYAPGHEVFLHPVDVIRRCAEYCNMMILNNHEAAAFVSRTGTTLAHLSKLDDSRIVVVTRGAEGVSILWRGSQTNIPAFRTNVVDTTGAGDCFAAAFIVRVLVGDSVETAARYACAASSLVVEHLGCQTHVPTPEEICVRVAASGDNDRGK